MKGGLLGEERSATGNWNRVQLNVSSLIIELFICGVQCLTKECAFDN